MFAADSNDEINIILSIIGIGILFVVDGVRRMLTLRRVEDAAKSSIAHAPQGKTEIEAFAWSLSEPVKNSREELCAYYRIELQEWQRRGKNHRWVTIWTHTATPTFLALDKTGAVIVHPDSDDLVCTEVITSWKKLLNLGTGQYVRGLIQTHYGAINTGWLASPVRVVENYFRQGSPCYVQGELSTGQELKSHIESPTLVLFYEYLKKKPPGYVHTNQKYDLDQDGEITADEVSRAIHKIASNIYRYEVEPSDLNDNPQRRGLVVYGKVTSSQNQSLIVANMHEHHFRQSIGSWNLMRVIGGASLIAVGSVLALKYFNRL